MSPAEGVAREILSEFLGRGAWFWIGRPPDGRVSAPGEPLTLRVYVDGSVVEVFANDRACRTLRTYAPGEADAVGLVVEAGEARVVSIDAWEMRMRT